MSNLVDPLIIHFHRGMTHYLTCISDISRSREEGPVQLCLKTFPRTQHGTRKVAFNSSWYKDNSWFEYSVNQDSTYCFACRHFSLPNTPEFACQVFVTGKRRYLKILGLSFIRWQSIISMLCMLGISIRGLLTATHWGPEKQKWRKTVLTLKQLQMCSY